MIRNNDAGSKPDEGTGPGYSEAESLLQSDPATARDLASGLALNAEIDGDSLAAAKGLWLSGKAAMSLGDIIGGLADFERGLACTKGDDRAAAIRVRLRNGIGIACHQLGRYPEADRSFERALASARRLGDREEIRRSLCNYGFAKSEAGRCEDALAYLTEALEIGLESASGSYEKVASLPLMLSRIGSALLRLGRSYDALSYQDRAIEAARLRGDRIGLATALCGRGETLLALEQMDEAVEALSDSLSICLFIGANLAGVRTALVLSRYHLDCGELDEAESVIGEWLDRAATSDSLRHAELVRLRGRLLSLKGRWREAYEASEMAGELERKVGLSTAATAALAADRGKFARRSRRLVERVEGWGDAVNLTLAALIEAKDHQTGRHVDRAAAIVRHLGERIMRRSDMPSLDAALLEAIVRFAPLHDIGKIAIPDSVLGKRGPLDPGERDLMQRHVIVGKEILLDAAMRVRYEPSVKVAAEIAGYHHERWDGSGYPEGRSGEAIPIAARIVAVADVYDAIRSERPYKPAYPRGAARDYVIDNAGLHFDPRIVEAFSDCEEAIAALYAS